MKLKEHMNDTIKIAMEEPLLIFGASFAALLLSALSLSIMGPVLAMGMAEIFSKMRRGEKAEFNDLFIHVDKVLLLFVQALLIGAVAVVSVITVLGPLFIAALWMYAPYYFTFRNEKIVESMKSSANLVMKNNLMLHIAIVLVVAIMFALGAKLFAIGTLIVYPFITGMIKFVFDEIS